MVISRCRVYLVCRVDRDFGLKVAESEIAAKQTPHESRNRVSYAASQTVCKEV